MIPTYETKSTADVLRTCSRGLYMGIPATAVGFHGSPCIRTVSLQAAEVSRRWLARVMKRA